MASTCCFFVGVRCKNLFTRKLVWPLAVSGFLFSCLHLYDQLPEFDTWQNGHSRNHQAHLIRFSAEDGEWVADIAHFLSRAPEVKVGSTRLSVPDKINLDSKSHNVSKFQQRRRNKRHRFHSDKKRKVNNMRDKIYSNVVGNRKKGREFDRITRYKQHRNRTHDVSVARSAYNIRVGVKERGKRGDGSESIRVFMADPNSAAEMNQKQVGLIVNINSDHDRSSQQQLNIFSLKAHKTAATTAHSIVRRFALSNRTAFILTRPP